MPARAFIGAGDLYINRIDPATGLFTGLVGPYECERFGCKTNAKVLEKVSKGKATYGQVIATVMVPQPAELEIALGETSASGMALALQGTTASLSQGSGSITDEALIAKLGIWVPASKAKFQAAGFVVKHTSGTPTYTLGTDYEVNLDMGWVRAKAGGAITDGQSLKVSGTYQAISGTKVRGATNAQVRAMFVLDGKDIANDTLVKVTVYEGVVSSGDLFNFLADEFNTVPLKGRMVTPAGYNEPFVVDLHGVSS